MSKITTTSEKTNKVDYAKLSPAKSETLHISKPLGNVNVVSLLCGGVAALIAVVLDVLRRYDSLVLSVQQIYQSKPFFLESLDTWHRSWDWTMAIILSSLVSYVVLDSAGKGKRIFFGIASLILIVMFSPLLMLWGIFLFPITTIVAVTFAWVFALIYSSLHIMPCELGVKMKLVKNKKVKNKKTETQNPISEVDSILEKEPSFQPIVKSKK